MTMYDGPEVARKNGVRSLKVQTGLSADMARYYSPTIGRFISEDPIRVRPGLYSYSLNYPTKYTDPFGLFESDADHQTPSIPPDKMRRVCPGSPHGCFFGIAALDCDCYPVGPIKCPKYKPLVHAHVSSRLYTLQNDPNIDVVMKQAKEAINEFDRKLYAVLSRISWFEDKEYPSYDGCMLACDEFVAKNEIEMRVFFHVGS